MLPGYVAWRMDPQILSVLSGMVREKILVTMGTNGKTTTNRMLCHVLEASGKKVVVNRNGANMRNGVITAFVLATEKGRLDADYACIEADEAAAEELLGQLGPQGVLLTNIARDQLDRFGEVDIVCEKLQAALARVPRASVIINGDDAKLAALAGECPNPVVVYGINEPVFDDISRSSTRESSFCLRCGEKLTYDLFHYGHLGIYHCPGCGWKRPTPDYVAENICFRDGSYSFDMVETRMESVSGVSSAYNIYNTLAAYAALRALDIPCGGFASSQEHFDYGNDRESIFYIKNALVQLHLAKNPMGFSQKLSMLGRDRKPKDVILVINDAWQDGRDVSWLWDVGFQYLKEVQAKAITVSGTRRYDMALRLKYEDIACAVSIDLKAAIEKLAAGGTGNVYVIVNYSGLYPAKKVFEKLQKAKTKK